MRVPTLVDFWAPWCVPCRQLMPILDRLAEEYAGRLRLTKVDTDAQRELARQLSIRALPTVVLFKDGTTVAHFTGLQPEAQIRRLLDQHLPGSADDPLKQAQVLKAAGDFASARTLMENALTGAPDDIRYQSELIALQVLDGDLPTASDRLERLQRRHPQHPAVHRLSALLTFSGEIARQPDVRALRAQAEREPGCWQVRHALAAHQLLGGDVEPALEYWLSRVGLPGRQGELAHRSLLQAFELIGEADPIVARSRQRMARLRS